MKNLLLAMQKAYRLTFYILCKDVPLQSVQESTHAKPSTSNRYLFLNNKFIQDGHNEIVCEIKSNAHQKYFCTKRQLQQRSISNPS